MLAIRQDAYFVGALWLGIAIALKGYALCVLPAFCVFIFYQRGSRAAIYCGVIALVPMTISLIVTSVFSGLEGTSTPFRQQALRNFNGESIYDAFNYLLGTQLKANQIPLVPQALQIIPGLIAAAMRPRTFLDLVNAFIFAVLGFMTFSPFYSPQQFWAAGMSALGQKQTLEHALRMSALPPKADILSAEVRLANVTPETAQKR